MCPFRVFRFPSSHPEETGDKNKLFNAEDMRAGCRRNYFNKII